VAGDLVGARCAPLGALDAPAAGITTVRRTALPRWLGWAAILSGIRALPAGLGFIGSALGLIWILVAGILIFRKDLVAKSAPEARRPWSDASDWRSGIAVAANGVDLVTIQTVMGQNAIVTTGRYLRARPASEQAARFTPAFDVTSAPGQTVAVGASSGNEG
jgi:hypothetical protein